MSRPCTDALAAAALVLLWSSGFVGAVLGTSHAAPDTLLAWRFLVASVILVPVALARGARFRPPALRRHVPLGVLSQFLYLGGTVTGVALGVTMVLLPVDRRIVGGGRHDGRRERARRFLARHP